MLVKLVKGDKTFTLQADSYSSETRSDGLVQLTVFNDGALIADEIIGSGTVATYDSATIVEGGAEIQAL